MAVCNRSGRDWWQVTAPDPARLHQSIRQLEGDGGRVDVELSVDCPACGAKAGKRCVVSYSGRLARETHRRRVSKAQRLAAEEVDPADELYLDSIRREGDETVVRMHGAEQTLGHMALAMREVFTAQPEGTNYVEMGVNHEGKTWHFAVYPAGKPTPHQKRQEAEAALRDRDDLIRRQDAALTAVRELHAAVEYLGQQWCEHCADPGYGGVLYPCPTVALASPDTAQECSRCGRALRPDQSDETESGMCLTCLNGPLPGRNA